MMRRRQLLTIIIAALGLGACTGQIGISGGGPTAAEPARVAGTRPVVAPGPARPELPREWVEGICDRVEDCAVERNTTLVEKSGGTPEDVAAAKHEAQQALVSGDVRAFCLIRTRKLSRQEAERIVGCQKRVTGCEAFYQCADFRGAESRTRTAAKAGSAGKGR